MKLSDFIANGTGHGIVYGSGGDVGRSEIAAMGVSLIAKNIRPMPDYCQNKTERIIGRAYSNIVSVWKREGIVESTDVLYRTVLACENLYDDDDTFFMPLLFGWAVPNYTIVLVKDYHILYPAERLLLARTRARLIAFGEPCVAMNDLGGTLCELP